MRYKGHTLETHYLPGATFRIKDGEVLPRTPKKEDIDFVRVIPDDGSRALNCKNMAEAKAWVNHCVDLGKTPYEPV